MILDIEHVTRFTYSQPVFLEPHVLRLRPRCGWNQRLLDFELEIDPRPEGCARNVDLDGNATAQLWFSGLHDGLRIAARSRVETLCSDPFAYLLAPEALVLPVYYPGQLERSLVPYRGADRVDWQVVDFARELVREVGGQTQEFLLTLCQHIYKRCEKIIRLEGDPLPAGETLRSRRGACRDLAVLFMDACRSVGLAARFVSGYQGEAAVGERYLHAWAEVFLPGAGWRGYDPSFGLVVADAHVALAAGPAHEEVRPVQGNFRGMGVEARMGVEVRIEASAVDLPPAFS